MNKSLLPHSLGVSPEIMGDFPDYTALAIYASGLVADHGARLGSEALLLEAQESLMTTFPYVQPSDHPHLAAWRKAYSRFGAKPSRTLNGAEALIKRVLKGSALPSLSPVVNVYNAVSVKHVLPIGGEDLSKLSNDLTLAYSDGTEPFETLSDEGATVERPEIGEVVWRDSLGVTCRKWNWRQCHRTAITDATTDAYFVLDAMAPYGLKELTVAADELEASLRALMPGAVFERNLLAPKPQGGDRGEAP